MFFRCVVISDMMYGVFLMFFLPRQGLRCILDVLLAQTGYEVYFGYVLCSERILRFVLDVLCAQT